LTDYEVLEDGRLAVIARDDHAAFDTLYRRHVTAVYRYCITRTPTQADAEDVTAQTFLAALEAIDRYRAHGAFLAWLFGIARHKCADVHRGNRGYAETPLEEVTPFHANPGTAPEEAANDALLMDCVERMMDQLSPDRQEALQLRYWADLSLKDVASAMNRSMSAIKMLISRGIADLRERCAHA
jgi:RNA polymerase sigma-70 factor (ECF subfamily)